ncbi:hypothetical protein V6B95_03680 [Thermoanaerobacterium saccharolyticum]|uniref:MotA/TolQ/ExbB proton channel family protein n=1 Tax=Thermoanaerobacterium butyriciformans TaxID=1702242 RepID=A0ABS4NCF6_9THEO|nr:hypothetical protein [Thermoanaerobacterium butyriciformans]MBP2071367.1 hypothetical protein [Thermoanaerobacterium butyriciformans]
MINKVKNFFSKYIEANKMQSKFILFSKCHPLCLCIMRYVAVIIVVLAFLKTLIIYMITNQFQTTNLLLSLFLFIAFLLMSVLIETCSKNLNKVIIQNKIGKILAEYSSLDLAIDHLSRIIFESSTNKDVLEKEIGASNMPNIINGTMQIISFLVGFFANTLSEIFRISINKDIGTVFPNLNTFYESIFIFSAVYVIILFTLYLLAEIFKSYNLYYIHMFDYQIKYVQYTKTKLIEKKNKKARNIIYITHFKRQKNT